ncbi:MAG TPA: alanine racemase C-terminal domain-containing protein [Microbacterium sp.]|uniref:alanine racemase C-terminal domain-containing protein n=1 Tax=Microbacterium sp. TaxID=51671 RepID=UPI002C6F6435|nr:alanine racemase C-terminal domain-containing protein [Microbacterium sp.]HWI32009.1 alanine racemase C-terminal domain-containing protein [Microbacterium sp.]
MTSGIPGRPAPAGSPKRSTPAARISRAALATNLEAVLAGIDGGVIDVRADAWGHGSPFVARAARDAGAAGVLADESGVAALRGVVEPALVVTSGPAIDPNAVFGLSGATLPVLSLHGWVLSLKTLRAGEGVSYGYTHRASRDTTVALVTGGYAQGIVRALGNAASVAIDGRRHPIVGRVAMDVCVVDVGESRVARGDEVAFFGDPRTGMPGIGEWVAATGMTAGELAAAVGLRAAREFVP